MSSGKCSIWYWTTLRSFVYTACPVESHFDTHIIAFKWDDLKKRHHIGYQGGLTLYVVSFEVYYTWNRWQSSIILWIWRLPLPLCSNMCLAVSVKSILAAAVVLAFWNMSGCNLPRDLEPEPFWRLSTLWMLVTLFVAMIAAGFDTCFVCSLVVVDAMFIKAVVDVRNMCILGEVTRICFSVVGLDTDIDVDGWVVVSFKAKLEDNGDWRKVVLLVVFVALVSGTSVDAVVVSGITMDAVVSTTSDLVWPERFLGLSSG